MSVKIKLAAWLTITALLFTAMHSTPLGVALHSTPLGIAFASTVYSMAGAVTMGGE